MRSAQTKLVLRSMWEGLPPSCPMLWHGVGSSDMHWCPAGCCTAFLQVVREFKPATAISNWPKQKSTQFALQYGLKDDLAPPNLSLALMTQLNHGGLGIKVCCCTVVLFEVSGMQ